MSGFRLFPRAVTLLAHTSIACTLLISARAQLPAPPSDKLDLRFANGIAAVAEDKIITVDDIRREIAPLVPEIQRTSKNEKEFNERLESLQEDVVQNLIDRVLIVKEFFKEKDGEPKKQIPASYIDNQISEILITQFDNDRSKFLGYLRSRGKTMRDYRKEVEEDMIYGYMRQQQRKSQSIVSPVKVETYYKENQDKFFREDGVHLRLIQFRREEGETDQALTDKANTVLNRMKAGEKFEDIAKEVSQDTRRSKGGDWGWQKRSDLKPELSDPLFQLAKGEVTKPIVMPEGAFLLYVEDRRFAGVQSIDEVRDEIERILVQQMARVSQDRWLERLRRNGYVKHY
ncbi:MAG: peptidyl-prolyl cis-trans isomerase [Nibricoccus sp.]